MDGPRDYHTKSYEMIALSIMMKTEILTETSWYLTGCVGTKGGRDIIMVTIQVPDKGPEIEPPGSELNSIFVNLPL